LRRYVNGEEVEFDPNAARVSKLPDRLIVHSDEVSYSAVAVRTGDKVQVSYKGRVYTVESAKPRARAGHGAGNGELRAPMPGQIVDVLVSQGDTVKKGQKLLVLEAMKTQQPFTAPFDGTVEKLSVEKGKQVGDGEVLAVLKAEVSDIA
jgi:biotin carboxyl carrier protein